MALMLWVGGQGALAQKSGGILKMPDFASPASMSIHEEVTRAAVTVLMPVFNNLVLFDQHKERNTIDTIVPDLAESWACSENGKDLTFKLRHGVKWHDGKAVHRRRRQVYLGPLAREDAGEIAPQSAEGVVPQPRRGHDQR
jgi:peptide/nickel transport system substrate-binding protein